MAFALLLARFLLAAVFVVAGLAKFSDRTGSRQALIDFGVPAVLATPAGLVLPLTELVVAVALVPTISAWWGAIAALAQLVLFVVGIGYNLARGRQSECHCFGQASSRPISWSTLVRNLLLAVVAVFIVGFGRNAPGLNLLGWLGALALIERIELIVGLILVVLVALEGWILWHVLRQQGACYCGWRHWRPNLLPLGRYHSQFRQGIQHPQ